MLTRDQWDAMTAQQFDHARALQSEIEALTKQNRPIEGNGILRIDLELPAEEIAAIQEHRAFRVSVETP